MFLIGVDIYCIEVVNVDIVDTEVYDVIDVDIDVFDWSWHNWCSDVCWCFDKCLLMF